MGVAPKCKLLRFDGIGSPAAMTWPSVGQPM
jgi:hypothetical protein